MFKCSNTSHNKWYKNISSPFNISNSRYVGNMIYPMYGHVWTFMDIYEIKCSQFIYCLCSKGTSENLRHAHKTHWSHSIQMKFLLVKKARAQTHKFIGNTIKWSMGQVFEHEMHPLCTTFTRHTSNISFWHQKIIVHHRHAIWETRTTLFCYLLD